MESGPSQAVLEAFGCRAEATRLTGGQGSAWKSGDLILKPMYDPDGAVWEAQTLISMPCRGYRVAQPVPTTAGQWTHEGWTAWGFLEGVCPHGAHVSERFEAARALHQDLAHLPRPSHFDRATDPWALADKVAFGIEPWNPDERIRPCLDRFRRAAIAPGDQWQVIHGDLAGNYLILDGTPPAIIDFTPKWSPAGFGEAVMAVDLCLWENVPVDEALACLTPAESSQLPLAAARRLLEVDTRHRRLSLTDSVFEQVQHYERFATSIGL